MRVGIATLGVLIGLLAASTFAADAVESRATTDRARALRSQLDQNVPKWLKEYAIPSVSIAHIEDGRTVLAAAYGVQSPGVPATPDTLYNIASMTKPISAEVILRLVSKGQIALDEPMHPYWVDPDVANDERHKFLTPRLALSHQTGFPNWRYETGDVLIFKRTPGEAYGYSGEGYEYVARFAEKKTGKPFEELAQKLIFDPAGMKNTAYTRRPWFDGRIAAPTDSDGKTLNPSIPGSFIASDDMHTTASEYATFLLSVMNHDGLTEAIAKDRETIQLSRKADTCPPANTATCPEDMGPGLGLGGVPIQGRHVSHAHRQRPRNLHLWLPQSDRTHWHGNLHQQLERTPDRAARPRSARQGSRLRCIPPRHGALRIPTAQRPTRSATPIK